jgi:translation initiation factor 1A
MKEGDWILVALRDFDEKKVDVIHKYNDDEVRRLRKDGAIFETGTGNANALEEDNEDADVFTFEDI